jgi:hypothetical protein
MSTSVETFFLITVNTDGTLSSYTEIPENMPVAARTANTFDVYQSSKQIVDEFEQSMLADRIAKTVVAQLNLPAKSEVPNRIKDALKERGIDPESVTPTA